MHSVDSWGTLLQIGRHRGSILIESGGRLGNDSTRSQENRDALLRLIEEMDKNRQLVAAFQTTIRQTPALTGKFKRARQRTASMLGELIAEVSFFIEEGKRILAGMETNEVAP